jgi:cytoskeletal protein RodZ
VGTPLVAAATADDLPSHTVPEEARKRQIRWGRVAMIAGAVFVLAMGSLTIFELVTGKSVASTVGNNSGGGTTIGSILDSGKSKSTPAPTTSTTPTDSPSDGTTTQPTAPATDATTAPTTEAPTTAPTTVAPTTDAPAPTTAPAAGGNAGGGNPQGDVQTGGTTAGQ